MCSGVDDTLDEASEGVDSCCRHLVMTTNGLRDSDAPGGGRTPQAGTGVRMSTGTPDQTSAGLSATSQPPLSIRFDSSIAVEHHRYGARQAGQYIAIDASRGCSPYSVMAYHRAPDGTSGCSGRT